MLSFAYRSKDAIIALDDGLLLAKWYFSKGEFTLNQWQKYTLSADLIESCMASMIQKACDKKFQLKMPLAIQRYFLAQFASKLKT